MFFTIENALAALVDQMRTYWVLHAILGFIPGLLLRKQDDCSVIFWPMLMSFHDCVSYISPYIRCVVSIKIDNLLMLCHICSDSFPVHVRQCVF